MLSRLVLVWSCSAPRNRQGSMPGLIHQVWFFVRFTGHIYPGRDRTAASMAAPETARSCHPLPCDLLQSGASVDQSTRVQVQVQVQVSGEC